MSGRYVGRTAVRIAVVAVLMTSHLGSAQSLPGILGHAPDGSCDRPGGWTPLCGGGFGHSALGSSFNRRDSSLGGGLGGEADRRLSRLSALRASIGGYQPMHRRDGSSSSPSQIGYESVASGGRQSYRCINGGCAELESDKPVSVRLSDGTFTNRHKRTTELETQR